MPFTSNIRHLCSIFRTTGVNLKNTGLTTVVPAISGKKFIVTRVYVEITALTGAGTPPTMQAVGLINGDTAGILAGPTALLDDVVGGVTYLAVGQASGSFWAADLGTAISIQATAAGTVTTMTGSVYVEGFYL